MKSSWNMMSFTASEIADKMDKKIFVVPPYQRGVVWSKEKRISYMIR